MVNATYDHIVAIILVGVIFVWVVGVLPATSLVSINAADQQQLRNTGLNVFNAMLLDTGEGFNETANQNTTNWGSLDPFEAEDIIRFGLASTEDSASYVLDPDKVQRLEIGNPLGTINNTIAKSLMELEGYGFALEIIPPFNVTNVDGTKIDGNNSPINIPAYMVRAFLVTIHSREECFIFTFVISFNLLIDNFVYIIHFTDCQWR